MRACRGVAAAVALVVVAVATPTGAAAAQFENLNIVRIEDYRIRMAIQNDGDVDVTEVIHVDFADNQRHGIFRHIQVRFDYNPDPRYERVYKIGDVHVEATGISAHNEISNDGRYKIFKIGDADETRSGRHTYTITYTIRGALNGFDDHDELYWNAIGAEWDMPIARAQVDVTAPGGMQDVRCLTGPYGSTETCDVATRNSATGATFIEEALNPGDNMTFAVALAKGVVPRAALEPILDEKWSITRAFAVTPATLGGAAAVLVVFGALILRLIWRTGRDRRVGAGGADERVPVFGKDDGPVQYRPPDDARPAQIGVLIDEVAHPLDVTATIVDLGVRGFLTIEQTQKDGFFSDPDWRLSQTKDDDGSLLTYERRLFNALFDGRSEVSLSELKNEFASDLRGVQESLYADAVTNMKWFAQRPDRVRGVYLGVGIVATIVSIGVVVLLAAFTHAALVAVPLVILALVLLAAHRHMPARTSKGSQALAQTLGFKRYIDTAEADRMKFAEEENIFAKYLPYAIVFKNTDRWAKAFQDMYGDAPPPGMGWYHPYGTWNAFSFGHFASSMSSFAVQTSGTIVSTPASSGGSGFSSGGGFSGGGGGGGGGGSW